MTDSAAREPVRIGRQPITTVGELSHVAFDLFLQNGFNETTVDDIVAAAGIGRRTFFRYFPSKNDLPWGDFELLTVAMSEYLEAVPIDIPLVEALEDAIVEFNRYPADELEYHRQRMRLLFGVPALVAHSNLRYASWRAVIAVFVARRLGCAEFDEQPQTIAWITLAASLAAYEQWLRQDEADLLDLIRGSFRILRGLFAK